MIGKNRKISGCTRVASSLLFFALINSANADFKSWLLDEKSPGYFKASSKSVELDASAQRCMSCHNGSAAAHVSVKDAGQTMQIQGYMTVNHPIGMYYEEYVQQKPRGYRPSSMLDPEIQLVNGKVSCVSCHLLKQHQAKAAIQSLSGFRKVSLHASDAESCEVTNHLTTGPRQTDLCLSCHIK